MTNGTNLFHNSVNSSVIENSLEFMEMNPLVNSFSTHDFIRVYGGYLEYLVDRDCQIDNENIKRLTPPA